MFKLDRGSTRDLKDVEDFVSLINTIDQHPLEEARGMFAPNRPIVVARAPGRLDVMGGFADYSGSLVLQMPTREASLTALQRIDPREIRIVSLGHEANDRDPSFVMALDDLEEDGKPITYAAARTKFADVKTQQWAAYIAGSFLALMREKGARFEQGATILIDSAVPEGKGVSSSAAIEISAMQAIAAACDIALDAREMAILCQKVENLVVGAPCGVMDQMTAACGESGKLLSLLCRPAELRGNIAVPEDLRIWGIDSGIRHAVSGSDYTSVRVGAFMGYRIIADLAGLEVEPADEPGVVKVNDPKWHGYLANMTPREFNAHYVHKLPETMTGEAFLGRYGGTTDRVASIRPENSYPVLKPTQHPIYENTRVHQFAEILRGEGGEEARPQLGMLMMASHQSYSDCGVGTEATDLIAKLVRDAGADNGLLGAKISGGGSGGTVVVLGRADAQPAIARVAELYEERTGRRPYLFAGSSLGAAEFGHLVLQPR